MSVFRFVPIHGLATLMLGLSVISGSVAQAADSKAASVELSPLPPNAIGGLGVAPNVVVTLDNTRSMFRNYSPETRPFDSGNWDGPWKCAAVIDPRITDSNDIRSHAMNGVYYNPGVKYLPPVNADGSLFADAPASPPIEGVARQRPRKPIASTSARYAVNLMSADSSGVLPDGTTQDRGSASNLENGRQVSSVTIPYQVLVRKPQTKEVTTSREVWIERGVTFCPDTSNAGKGRYGYAARGCACFVPSEGNRWFHADDHSNYRYYRFSTCRRAHKFKWIEIVYDKTTRTDYIDTYETRYRYESKVDDQRWLCGADATSPLDNSGGPYYYRYKSTAPSIQVDAGGNPTAGGLGQLYNRNNWEAVRENDTGNFANWYAYYRTPTLMMRTVLSRAFAKPAAGVAGGGYGSDAVRVAWQNFGRGDPFRLQDGTIISRLMDANSPACKAATVDPAATGVRTGVVKTPPNCYRSAFFNWLFDDSNFSETPLSAANSRAGNFFKGGDGNTGKTGDLHDPYWEPPAKPGEDGQRLTCRQNFHLVMTDKGEPADQSSLDADSKSRSVYFPPGHAQNLVDRIGATLADMGKGALASAGGGAKTSSNLSAVNASVLVSGALGFTAGYDTADWSGTFQAMSLTASGEVSTVAWDAGAILDDAGRTNPAARNILTARWNNLGFSQGMAFKLRSELDLDLRLRFDDIGSKAGATGQEVVDYLRGDRSKEGTTFRKRNHLLGAISGSQAVYVGRPSSGYRNSWPAKSPEQQATAGDSADCGKRTPSTCRSYEAFVQNHLGRKPAVYVGANDGMLHAFDASLTTRAGQATPSPNAGKELFAYMPREVSVKLPDLTRKDSTRFVPTVDGVPVTRDVYFSQTVTAPVSSWPGWRTLLVGGLRMGGRGVYALDVTDPASMDAGKVLWEFHANMSDFPAWRDGSTVNPGGKPSNLGYTYGQPNIGRLNNGKWVVLVPGGYFADCAKAAFDGCHTPPAAANTYSSLFVLDAQTGKLIRELKTSDAGTGVTSRGLSSPVLGDYNDDQVDDVSFAGDLDGNLWRYDLSSADPAAWKVTLAFKPATAGAQPITSMPRLFGDPATGKFIVVFGTGKYLGAGDSGDSTTQSIYGIRDVGATVARSQLVAQTLSEATADDGKSTARGLTDRAVPADKQGWYFDLIAPGERMVVTPAALFDSGRVVIQTLIPGGGDPCDSSVQGALMVVNAANGGSGGGISALSVRAWAGSGTAVVGGRVDKPRGTSGSMPVVSAMGGGSLLVPGLKLSGSGELLTIDDALWRRRSWRRITP